MAFVKITLRLKFPDPPLVKDEFAFMEWAFLHRQFIRKIRFDLAEKVAATRVLAGQWKYSEGTKPYG